MYHVYSTAITRRYLAVRGRALAITGFGMHCAEAGFPVVMVIALSLFDWRYIWVIVPLFAFISFAPFISALTQRSPFQDGPGRTETENTQKDSDGAQSQSIRRSKVVRDRAFWAVIIWLMMVPGFTITGLFFHQIHIASALNIELWLWSSNYIWYALFAVIGALLSGYLVDRFTAHKSAVLSQIPMILACLCLMLAQHTIILSLFFCLFGLAGGMIQPLINALLAERYGTRWLGEIKALASPLNVFSSALSPAVMFHIYETGATFGTYTKIEFLDVFIVFQVFRSSIHHHPSVFKNVTVGSVFQCDVRVLFCQKKTDTFFLIKILDDFKDFLNQLGSKTHRWFVE